MAPTGAIGQPASGRGGEARASFDLVRTYLAELRNPAGKAPAAGPTEFRLERKSGETVASETAPIARLAAMLRNCRKASFSASWGNPADARRAAGRQHWECLGEGAEDRSVLVTAVSSDGKNIESVTALLGGPIYWPGPSPSGMAQPTKAEVAEFEANRERAFAFLEQLAQGKVPPPVPEAVLWAGSERKTLSLERVRQMLAPCERIWGWRDSVRIDGALRSGVSLGWKCDKRSTAHADLSGIVTLQGGAVDHFYISPYLDYAIPLSKGGQE